MSVSSANSGLPEGEDWVPPCVESFGYPQMVLHPRLVNKCSIVSVLHPAWRWGCSSHNVQQVAK